MINRSNEESLKVLVESDFDSYYKLFTKSYKEFRHNHESYSQNLQKNSLKELLLLCTPELINKVGAHFFSVSYKIDHHCLSGTTDDLLGQIEKHSDILMIVDEKLMLSNKNSKIISDYLDSSRQVKKEVEKKIVMVAELRQKMQDIKEGLIDNRKKILVKTTKLRNLQKLKKIIESGKVLAEFGELINILLKNPKKIKTILEILNKGDTMVTEINSIGVSNLKIKNLR